MGSFIVAPSLLLLTGLRKNELLSARWEHVDLDRKEIRLPETKSGGQQTRRLSDPAAKLLSQMPRQADSPWVFPGESGNPRDDFKRAWDRVRAAADLHDVTIHDLRRTCGSYMAQAGVPLQVIQEVLGHSHPGVTRVYARLSAENEREALNTLAKQLSDLLGVESAAPSASAQESALFARIATLVNASDEPETLASQLRALAADLEASR